MYPHNKQASHLDVQEGKPILGKFKGQHHT